MKPFFWDKSIKKKEITSIDDEKLITSDYEVAGTLNRYFDNAVRKLNINEPTEYMIHVGNIKDPTGSHFKICKSPQSRKYKQNC